ncbi:MAG: tRNA (adenosine(37)-N6)-dimethylallyltransferase MiaA [Dehalococcoidia bacterium]|nr:tRNA (adenosine(37)-N6)-dimethylallyltransferase MiaA [Dehalococcoidia bacterium]
MMNKLIAIVGPTAVGKTEFAIRLAQNLGGEIIGADSRQVYRYMDIGTAKPTKAEQNAVPHHLVDIIDPNESFSLALYQELSGNAIDNIHNRGKPALLVGGSGLYVWAVLEGWTIPKVPPNAEVRQELQLKAKSEGGDALYRELNLLDPKAAQKIDPRNVRRVIRALEVCRSTGRPFSELSSKNSPEFDTLIIGLSTPRDELYRRIDSRVDGMIEQGLVEEVKSLLGRGYGLELPSMSGMGYREIGQFLNGEMSLPEAAQRIKFETHRFARHQYAWFRLGDERIHWFETRQKTMDDALNLARTMLTGE